MKDVVNKLLVKTVENAAVKSADSLSWFFLYQPKTPSKLTKNKK